MTESGSSIATNVRDAASPQPPAAQVRSSLDENCLRPLASATYSSVQSQGKIMDSESGAKRLGKIVGVFCVPAIGQPFYKFVQFQSFPHGEVGKVESMSTRV